MINVENDKFQKVEKQILCAFPRLSVNGLQFVMLSDSSTFRVCFLQSCTTVGFRDFSCSSYPLLVAKSCLSVCLHFVCLSVPWLSSYSSPQSVSPNFFFILCPILLAIAFLFGITVPQKFIVSVCNSSTNSVDKKNNKKKKNMCQSASHAILLCQYLAIVMHMEEIQTDASSVCISDSVITVSRFDRTD